MRIFLIAILIAVTTCACAAQQAKSDDKTIPKVTYCELMKHPEKFDDKVIEVTAIYGNGFEKSHLYDKDLCHNMDPSQARTWVAYDKSFVMDGDSEEAKTNSQISGFGVWEVTAIGRFKRAKEGRFGHLGCCVYQFSFMKIVRSEKLSGRAE